VQLCSSPSHLSHYPPPFLSLSCTHTPNPNSNPNPNPNPNPNLSYHVHTQQRHSKFKSKIQEDAAHAVGVRCSSLSSSQHPLTTNGTCSWGAVLAMFLIRLVFFEQPSIPSPPLHPTPEAVISAETCCCHHTSTCCYPMVHLSDRGHTRAFSLFLALSRSFSLFLALPRARALSFSLYKTLKLHGKDTLRFDTAGTNHAFVLPQL
jgi:hypothetical protein